MRAGLEMDVKAGELERGRHQRQQPERAGADAGRGGRGGGGRRAVRVATPTAAAMRFSGWARARRLPTPCTRRAAGPRRRRASARPSRCRPSASPTTRCSIRMRGFRYCDLLLTEAERAAWQVSCSGGLRPPEDGDAHRATLQAVSERAAQTLKWVSSRSRPPRHRPRPPHPGPRRALRGDSGGLVSRPLPRAPPARRGRPPPRRLRKTTSPAASSPAPGCAFSKANAPAPRARRATWTRPGKSPSAAP